MVGSEKERDFKEDHSLLKGRRFKDLVKNSMALSASPLDCMLRSHHEVHEVYCAIAAVHSHLLHGMSLRCMLMIINHMFAAIRSPFKCRLFDQYGDDQVTWWHLRSGITCNADFCD